jgi:hypothetical protein
VIHHYEKPFTHVIIENFFSSPDLSLIETNLLKVDSMFSHNQQLNEKPNKTYNSIWLYENKDVEEICTIARIIENRMWSNDMREIYKNTNDSAFMFYSLTAESHIEVIKKHKGWSRDYHRENYKSLTACIVISTNSMDINGIAFVAENKEQKTLQLKSNSCILFPSEAMKSFLEKKNDIPTYMILYHASPRYKFR